MVLSGSSVAYREERDKMVVTNRKRYFGHLLFKTLMFSLVPSVLSYVGVAMPSCLIQIGVAIVILALSYMLTLISKRYAPWMVGK